MNHQVPFEKDDFVVANNVEGHLQITLPLKPLNDTLKMEIQHYEEGKKRESIGLKFYLLCNNECKKKEKWSLQMHNKKF